jgi:hypothetical protein
VLLGECHASVTVRFAVAPEKRKPLPERHFGSRIALSVKFFLNMIVESHWMVRDHERK